MNEHSWRMGAMWMYWAIMRDGLHHWAQMTGDERNTALRLVWRDDPTGVKGLAVPERSEGTTP